MKYLLLILIAGLSTALVQYLFFYLLFHPHSKKQFLGISFQGIIPSKQKQWANKISKLLYPLLIKEIQSWHQSMDIKETWQHIEPLMQAKLDEFFDVQFPAKHPMMAILIGQSTRQKIKREIILEADKSFPSLLSSGLTQIPIWIDLEKLIRQKLESISSEKIEAGLKHLLKNEMGYLRWTGFFIGLLIGCIQVSIILLLRYF